MKRCAVLLIVMIFMISGCHKPAASTTPTPSAMATPTHTPTPTPKPTPAPAPTPQRNPRNTYETTGTVDGLICGLRLGMPMEEAEALLTEPDWIKDEYPFGTVEYGGPSGEETRIIIDEKGHAGPRGIEVGDDMYEAVHQFYVQEAPFKIDIPHQNVMEYDLYQTGQMSGKVMIQYQDWYTYRYEAPGVSLLLYACDNKIESITIASWKTESVAAVVMSDGTGSSGGQLTGHKRFLVNGTESQNRHLDKSMPEEKFPAANTGAPKYGEMEGDMEFLGLALGNDLTPGAVRETLGAPAVIWRDCEFGAVRYKYDGEQYFLYEIDINPLAHPGYGGKFLYGMRSGMSPDRAIGRMYKWDDGSQLVDPPWEGFEGLPTDGWVSVHDGPPCGLTLFGQGQASQENAIFTEGESYSSDDICLPDTVYQYWMYLGVDYYSPADTVVRQVIRYLWPDQKKTAPAATPRVPEGPILRNEDMVVDGIPLCESGDRIREKYGEPTKIEEYEDWVDGGTDYVWYYGFGWVYLSEWGDTGELRWTGMQINDPAMATPRDIRVGDPVEEITASFPDHNEYEEDGFKIFYRYNTGRPNTEAVPPSGRMWVNDDGTSTYIFNYPLSLEWYEGESIRSLEENYCYYAMGDIRYTVRDGIIQQIEIYLGAYAE